VISETGNLFYREHDILFNINLVPWSLFELGVETKVSM